MAGSKSKECPYCQENKKIGFKYCLACGRMINKSHRPIKGYDYYCPACSANTKIEHVTVLDRDQFCPRCAKKTRQILNEVNSITPAFLSV